MRDEYSTPEQDSAGNNPAEKAPCRMRQAGLVACAVALLAAIVLAYSNHFHNGFHFDDSHTIVNNAFIRDLRNIPRFFTDGTLFSSLPSNQSYRPIVSLSLAIDYGLGGTLDPFYFQLTGFLTFLLLVALLAVVIHHLLDPARKSTAFIGLLAAGLYGLHPANSDTVNYIISRSDVMSTLAVVASFAIYLAIPASRKWHWFVIPAVVGILAKPPAAMFAAIFAVYQLLFPAGWNMPATKSRRIATWLCAVVPSVILCGAAVIFVDRMTPKGWVAGAASAADYLRTQPYAAMLYVKDFFWPNDLSADYDLASITSFHDPRFWIGAMFMILLVACAVAASVCRRTRVIGFGLSWFVLALLPTSLLPLAEVINDHRAFFPFAGLAIALAGIVSEIVSLRVRWGGLAKAAAAMLVVLVLSVAGYATYQRNKVWKDEETLWRDVSIKSPRNARGLMNYGNTQMAKADYKTALDYFHRAQALAPNYPTLIINLAVAEGATGNAIKAEEYYIQAIGLAPGSPESFLFYARWLLGQSRRLEAMSLINRALKMSPGNVMANDLRTQALAASPGAMQPVAGATPEAYLQSSLNFYRAKQFRESMTAAESALWLRPDYPEAWNNLGAACNSLGLYNKAAATLQMALILKPDFDLARNNLAYARSMAAKQKPQPPQANRP